MKSPMFTRGVAFAGALTFLPTATALGASAHAATLLGATVHAASSSQATPVPSAEKTPLQLPNSLLPHTAAGGSSTIVRTIVGLFIVIAVIYGVTWILRLARKGKTRPTGTGLSRVATLPLGGGRSVAVVRAGREVMVIGVAENGVTPLRTYTEAEAIACGIDLPPEEASERAASSDPTERPMDRMLGLLRRMTVRS
jgi:flagellar protein FliO/FliZ